VGFFYITLVSFLTSGWRGSCGRHPPPASFFPAVSLEGRHMWLLRSSPLDGCGRCCGPVLGGDDPLLVLAAMLTGLTNVLLQVRPFMMVMELVTSAA